MSRVLVVDDDCGMRAALEARFLKRGWRVETAVNAVDAVVKFRGGMHPLVVTDIRMPGEDGFFVMRSVRQLAPNTGVILLTAYASIPDAVAAMKDGACDYLIKPVCFEQLEQAAERILERAASESRTGKDLVGHAPSWLKAIDRARQAAGSDADILIEAESGTGKELVARMIHRLSPRREHPFIAVNCAAFPETLLESELFGHVKGAFTGAGSAKPGKFELANEGTLLLDEVGEMPLTLQPKLLRVLQEREFDRLGDTRSVHINLRVIATTNRPLIQMVRDGKFRADLYYRLNVIPLSLPPLRERSGDIPELAQFFVQLYAPPGRLVHLAPEFLEALNAHSWPGNVRELANCIHRTVALSAGPEIGLSALESTDWLTSASPALPDVTSLHPGLSLEDMERKLFEMTLAATGGNRSRAAEMLGVSLRTVRNKVRSYGLPNWSSYVHE
ncbi:MAG TPA: sigma-54 dependent transcriptional regulator [Candidatus Sulfotelmatobacter sp.]|nr:sigma-54 dependent transcriptional regulator [Candidatus Sulfotelmatobacter sp.]